MSVLAVIPCAAQTQLSEDRFDSSYLEPLPQSEAGRPEPRVAFRLEREIPLPAPLLPRGPALVDGCLVVPVHGGVVRTGWAADASPTLIDGDGIAERPEGGWTVSDDGRYRARIDERDRIVVQKRCVRCSRGWRRAWRLRVAGEGLPAPLITDDRVYYGAMDNRVYAVRRKNGHRVWETDVQGRVARPLALWRPPAGSPEPDAKAKSTGPMVLVVPDHGTELVALDANTGAKAAAYQVPEDSGRLVGPPVSTPDGKIVVARRRYAEGAASLMVFSLAPPPATAKPDSAKPDSAPPDSAKGEG